MLNIVNSTISAYPDFRKCPFSTSHTTLRPYQLHLSIGIFWQQLNCSHVCTCVHRSVLEDIQDIQVRSQCFANIEKRSQPKQQRLCVHRLCATVPRQPLTVQRSWIPQALQCKQLKDAQFTTVASGNRPGATAQTFIMCFEEHCMWMNCWWQIKNREIDKAVTRQQTMIVAIQYARPCPSPWEVSKHKDNVI